MSAQVTSINYIHDPKLHTLEGAKAALSILFDQGTPKSCLDVGCGTGTWLRAAMDLGVEDVFGVDGIDLDQQSLLIPKDRFAQLNLSSPMELGRRFDVAFCLEVAEHLESKAGKVLIETLTKHSDTIFFSAACPGQGGINHINCQWPLYWQELFNRQGFKCDDCVRWKIWENPEIEPWYRQNMFLARRDQTAGLEPPIPRVYHPDVFTNIGRANRVITQFEHVRNGEAPLGWYVRAAGSALMGKLRSKLK